MIYRYINIKDHLTLGINLKSFTGQTITLIFQSIVNRNNNKFLCSLTKELIYQQRVVLNRKNQSEHCRTINNKYKNKLVYSFVKGLTYQAKVCLKCRNEILEVFSWKNL